MIYYGMPEKDVAKLKTLNTDVLMVFTKQSKWINQEGVTEFEQNMKMAKKGFSVKANDADHTFANPSNPKYSKALAEKAHAASVAYLKKNLKLK